MKEMILGYKLRTELGTTRASINYGKKIMEKTKISSFLKIGLKTSFNETSGILVLATWIHH